MRTLLYLTLFTLCVSVNSHAGDLKDAFDVHTSTPSTAFDGKQMQGVVGASFSARNTNILNRQIFSVQAPTWEAGCGGIDFFAGAFSVITKDELVQMARGIAAGAPGYFFNLAIDSVCPTCGANMKELARRLNSFNELAQTSCTDFWDNATEMSNLGDYATTLRSEQLARWPIMQQEGGLIDDYGTFMADSEPATAGKQTPTGMSTAEQKEIVETNLVSLLFNSDREKVSTTIDLNGLAPTELFMSFIGRVDTFVNDDGEAIKNVTPGSVNLYDLLFAGELGRENSILITRCGIDPAGTPEDKKCLKPNAPTALAWDGIVGQFAKIISNDDTTNPGIIQNINQRLDMTEEQKKWIATFPNNYEMWGKECYYNSRESIARYYAFNIAIKAVADIFNQISGEAMLSLKTVDMNGLTSPDDIKEIIKAKGQELLSFKQEVADLATALFGSLDLQVSTSSCAAI